MLDPEFIKKIKKMHIKTGRMVNTMMAGQYRSVFRGSGIEFEEVREYSPGDDVKSIDWKVSARMGRPYVKLYREERELVVMLLVDMSASGSFGTTGSIKREAAAEIAGVLAFNAIKNNDKVGAVLFTDRVEKYIPPKKGSAHVWRVIREIFSFEPQHRQTDIQSAVRYLGRVCRKKTVSFLISDFLSPEYIRQLKIVSKKHELIGIVLSDPGEFRLPEAGILSVEDLETGGTAMLDASDANTRKLFAQQTICAYRTNLDRLKSADIDYVEISTSDHVVDPLLRYFRARGK
ncbi:MAG: DUF58 domain-containing protein [Desulfobacterales bacterium]|nr:DUF58 domain-containing protein [Desulfobacterales bacterium]MDD4072585.1 DUF58 domain-containing protein [Desulfobacterales bacterium]MDD4391991.1 DUF58 domain-containing protein [Desulfobacterales bacterium]